MAAGISRRNVLFRTVSELCGPASRSNCATLILSGPTSMLLEPMSAYLLIAQKQYENTSLSGSYNVGPESSGCLTTGELADLFCQAWGEGAYWEHIGDNGPHEDTVLKLDCSKIRTVLSWRPRWNVERAVWETVAWTKAWMDGNNMLDFMERQIREYFNEFV